MRKWLKRILLVVGAIVIAVVALIAVFAFNISYHNNYKSQIQTLESPTGKAKFVLFTDISGFEDRAWYVYQLPINTEITKQMKTGHDKEGVLFWNYSEAGDHYDNPKIEIIKRKYLVFTRGGLFHSLYDIEKGQVLVNDKSPWNSFMDSQDKRLQSTGSIPPGTEKQKMDEWVRNNLHLKIQRILKNAT
jgi:hypothetical protein